MKPREGRRINRKKPVEERFWPKVHKTDSCWVWVGSLSQGYGKFGVDYKMVYAHRFSYELAKGPIPEGLELDHLCRNRACVNPDHLEPVTRLENYRRAPRYKPPPKEYCNHGHKMTPENTRITNRGARTCRRCSTEDSYRRHRLKNPNASHHRRYRASAWGGKS